jgi:hypothetical protein
MCLIRVESVLPFWGCDSEELNCVVDACLGQCLALITNEVCGYSIIRYRELWGSLKVMQCFARLTIVSALLGPGELSESTEAPEGVHGSSAAKHVGSNAGDCHRLTTT